ncbi:type I restriction modification DNA specificity domain protein [Bifidobacterium longum subsp. longum 35B]|uniref:Type I restriction modification DNA specificity domain protein n=1 Tax=Bifidobacterium longum subsp. longum 2-2B TaxID=1161745 RepID=A0AAV3FLE7_BIFLL|nr:type I restriction modification DNA specificity domain protein [Bifidobacterium longum subsp. longum 2-2B]EIJ25168.1 type I restriction modification DNA specificity domain protein [Bifidobacterium longum subsp. longum 35B]
MIFIKKIIHTAIRQIGKTFRLTQHIPGHHNRDKRLPIHTTNSNAIRIVVNNLYGHSSESNHYLPPFASSLIMHVLTNAEKLIPRRDAASLAESRKLAGIRIVTGTTSPFTRYERISVSPASCSIRSEYVIAFYTFKLQYKCNNSTPAWEQRKLGDIAERVTRKNENNESDLPLTISAQHGLIDQRLFFNAQVASRDMSGYYLLRQGEFAYNKSTSADSPWGAIKRLTRYEKGCVSTLYICFALLNANPDYLVTYYETNRWHKAVQMIAAEGARNHGLLNIAPDDFFDTMVSLPESQAEQQTIGAFFSRLDSLITLHQRKRLSIRQRSPVWS